jgi:Tol biopolymer transport system component
MKAKTSVVLALLALALVVAACGSAATTLPAPKTVGTIAFAKVVGKANADIYLVNADGTGLWPLTQTPDWEEDPSWSPDGSRILYAAYPPGNLYVGTASVWVMNADGSEKAQLSKGYGFGPAWSPDGKQIVYVAAVGGTASSNTPVVTAVQFHADVMVMYADGSGARNLTRTDALPSWTPDGDILFLSAGDLYSMRPDGTGPVRLTTEWNIGEYALSPDGKTLAYRSLVENAIVVRPLEGGGAAVTLLRSAQFITNDPFASFAWTQDGKTVAAAGSSWDGRGGSPLYVVNSDGSRLSQVPNVQGAYDPAWKPE